MLVKFISVLVNTYTAIREYTMINLSDSSPYGVEAKTYNIQHTMMGAWQEGNTLANNTPDSIRRCMLRILTHDWIHLKYSTGFFFLFLFYSIFIFMYTNPSTWARSRNFVNVNEQLNEGESKYIYSHTHFKRIHI